MRRIKVYRCGRCQKWEVDQFGVIYEGFVTWRSAFDFALLLVPVQ